MIKGVVIRRMRMVERSFIFKQTLACLFENTLVFYISSFPEFSFKLEYLVMISASVLKKRVADFKQAIVEHEKDLNERTLKVISSNMEDQAKIGMSSYTIPGTLTLPSKESGWSPTSVRLDVDKLGMIVTALKDAGYRVEEKGLSYTVFWD